MNPISGRSVAFDSIKTPLAKPIAWLAAPHVFRSRGLVLNRVRIVAVIGEDFAAKRSGVRGRNIDLAGLETVQARRPVER